MGEVVRSYLPPDLGRWWKNRRRMAYWSMLGLFVELKMLAGMSAERVAAASTAMICIAAMFFGIIVTYIVAATREDLAYISLKDIRP